MLGTFGRGAECFLNSIKNFFWLTINLLREQILASSNRHFAFWVGGMGGVFSNDILKVLGARYFSRLWHEIFQNFVISQMDSERTVLKMTI